jgi:chorismate-pyruvate lyase
VAYDRACTPARQLAPRQRRSVSVPSSIPDLSELISLFYGDAEELGRFEHVTVHDLPESYRGLLAHSKHMTVTVEAYHHSLVDVRVEAEQLVDDSYARKILLTRQTDGGVVLYGIMRIDLRQVGAGAREEILSRGKPLGRVLIEHKVLREVELVALWRINPGDDLARLFGVGLESTVYGRTALIYCNGEPAVELLEIVGHV